MYTIAEKLIKLSSILKKVNRQSADLESMLLICFVLDKPKTWILSHGEQQLTAPQDKELDQLIIRLLSGEPMSIILGAVPFIDEMIRVTSDVLTPRPETEIFISDLINHLSDVPPANILDVGTGSGAIAISLARAFPRSHVTGCDISDAALKIANQNGQISKLKNLSWVRSDLLDKIYGRFDLIVANLPYLTDGEMADLPPELKFEPRRALAGGKDGNRLVEKLITSSQDHLLPGAHLALEIHPQNIAKTKQILLEAYPEVKIIPIEDLGGIQRFIWATLQPA